MHEHILREIVLLLIAAVIAVAVFRRLKLPPILAYLFTGVAIGPYGLGWIANTQDTRFLAEFGVVFLLFTVGLEFSVAKLIAMRRAVLGLGGTQVTLSVLIAATSAVALGMSYEAAIVIGGALAMSSTAIVTKQLSEQLELNSRHGRLSIGVLLFQDLAVIPFLIIIPTLSSASDDTSMIAAALLWAFVKGFAACVIMGVAGHWIVRPLFRLIVAYHSAELFTLTVLLFSLAAAWLTESLGLSLVLGAFLAGMLMGETEYRHQVEADIRPFRDVLLGLFFVTIGMLLDVNILITHLHWVLLLVFAILSIKLLLVVALTMGMGIEKGVALRTGAVLAQSSEFGFALLALGLSGGIVQKEDSQIVLAAMIISMALSPLLIRHSGWLAKHFFADSYGANRKKIKDDIETASETLKDHVLIVGFGRVGQNIGRFLAGESIRYMALDLDPLRIKKAREAGEPVVYGDATHGSILDAAHLGRARILVVTVAEPRSTLKIINQARRQRADIPILVRTRDETNLERFQDAGATEVVPETLEASLMLVAHLLYLLNVPVPKILARLEHVRAQRYQLLRHIFPGQGHTLQNGKRMTRPSLHTVKLPSAAYAVGRTTTELKETHKNVVLTAIRKRKRGDIPLNGEQTFEAGDVVIMYGTQNVIKAAEDWLLRG